MAALPSDRTTQVTVEQYFALEVDAEVRHEYYEGELIGISGARRNHAVITNNVAGELRAQLVNRPECTAVSSDMRVRVSETIYFYPDVVAACDEKYTDSTENMLINPALVVEVTSTSTAMYDRTTKLEAYKRMPSVQEILIIDQHRVHITQHNRMANGWFVQEFTALTEMITLESFGCTLAADEIYAKVTFQP